MIHESNVTGVATDAQVLRDRLAGRVVLSGNEGWDFARQAWNSAVDQRPAVVVLPESVQDVLAVVEFAHAHHLAVAPQGTGHGALPLWPVERASEILHAWREWTDVVPDEVTSVGRLRKMPQIPEVPEQLRGRSFVLVEAAYTGAEADGIKLLRPLRALGPEIDTFQVVPMTGLGTLHMDPQQPMPRVGDGCLLAAFPAAAVDALVATTEPGSGSTFGSVEVRHLGGALARRLSEEEKFSK